MAQKSRTLLHNARVVTPHRVIHGYVLVSPPYILETGCEADLPVADEETDVIDCGGAYILPGAIDTHVHFRDPGLTEKADMATESAAAVAGGVTSFVDMPNTVPPTVTRAAVADKLARAAEVSVANYGFFLGATNDNIDEITAADYSSTAGVKLFLGSSTGNMLVDGEDSLLRIFKQSPAVIAVHAEDEATIRAARERLASEHPEGIPVELHPDMRPREACVKATRRAIELAEQTGARVHICHISTADELRLISEAKARGVKVTAETCPQYLLFDRNDFLQLGARVKCNPAIKEPADRIALLMALADGTIDTIATDHAPHLLAQKEGDAVTAASGMPMVQFSLPAILDLATSDPDLEGRISLPRIAELMAAAPARLFGIDRRGAIAPGMYADLVVIDHTPLSPSKVTAHSVLSRCGWSPLEGRTLAWRVRSTMVNGHTVFSAANGVDTSGRHAMPLKFNSNITI